MSLNIFISSPDTFSERRFDPHLTVGALKAKLEPITGIPVLAQVLRRFPSPDDVKDVTVPGVGLQDDARTLMEEGVREWECISVTNINPHANPEGEFTDVSRVDKYEISQDEYEKRNDTVLQDLKARKLGRFAPPAASSTPPPAHHATSDQTPGKRCIVRHPGTGAEVVGDEPRGTIEFVGRTEFGKGKSSSSSSSSHTEEGDWIGVRLDEPVGKNDGSVNGARYFTCKPNHGVFVRPERVLVGDWPEVDEFADEDEDEI